MGDVIPIVKFTALGPAQLSEIFAAFDDACKALPQPPLEATRGILAKRITELAERGQLDRQKLKASAPEYLEAEPRISR